MVTATRKGHEIVRNSSFFKKVTPQNVRPADAPASRKGKAETPSLPVLLPVLPDRRTPVPNRIPAAAPAERQRENDHPGPNGQAEGGDYNQVDDANSGDEEFVDAEGVDNPNEGDEVEPPQAVAYHPPLGINIDVEDFALPPDMVPRPYDFRPRP